MNPVGFAAFYACANSVNPGLILGPGNRLGMFESFLMIVHVPIYSYAR